MAAKQVVAGVYALALGPVNAFLIDDDGLTLIDTGVPGSADKILDGVRVLGRQPADIRRILVTHCHADHSGSLEALQRATGAPAYMQAEDAALVRAGKAGRPMKPVGLLGRIIVPLFIRGAPMTVEPARIEHEVRDGDELPFAGGLRAVHVPGHCAGQLAFLWSRHGGVLFAADAAANMVRLGPSIMYEDVEVGKRSLEKLARLQFEVACFGHGRPITSGAGERFRKKWGSSVPATATR